MNNLFIDTALGKLNVKHRPPVWIMRQAGRYIPEYNQIKAENGGEFWKLLKNPNLASKITLLPTKYIDIDALILFSDILVFLPNMGIEIDFSPGPKIRAGALEVGINNLKLPNFNKDLKFIGQTINKIKTKSDIPLIGFGGAPYTLMCYLLATKHNKNYEAPRKLYYSNNNQFNELLKILKIATINYLQMQINFGVDAVMLFDTWAGTLSNNQFSQIITPTINEIFTSLTAKSEIPKIYYVNPASHLIDSLKDLNSDVIGIDWRCPLNKASIAFSNKKSISGNLDPAILFSNKNTIKHHLDKILSSTNYHINNQRLIINLGAGIYPDTPLKNVQFMTKYINNYKYK